MTSFFSLFKLALLSIQWLQALKSRPFAEQSCCEWARSHLCVVSAAEGIKTISRAVSEISVRNQRRLVNGFTHPPFFSSLWNLCYIVMLSETGVISSQQNDIYNWVVIVWEQEGNQVRPVWLIRLQEKQFVCFDILNWWHHAPCWLGQLCDHVNAFHSPLPPCLRNCDPAFNPAPDTVSTKNK